MKYFLIVICAVMAAMSGKCTAAPERPAASLNWEQTGTSLALHNGTNVIWKLVFDPQQPKTYFHPLATIDGRVLTAFRPPDHPWHRGLWWAWKAINGLNYWEEDKKTGKSQGETELTGSTVTTNADFSARAVLTFSYHPPKTPSILTETLTLVISRPDVSGNYRIDWTSVFTATDKPLHFTRTPPSNKGGVAWGGYAGLSLRFPHGVKGWSFLTSENAKSAEAGVGKNARWADFSDATAGIAAFDHPDNLRHPSPWYLNKDLPYFSPALLYNDTLDLAPNQTLTLKYRVLVHSGVANKEALDAEWKAFVEKPLRDAAFYAQG